MRKLFIAGFVALTLASCATGNFHTQMERRETQAELAYQATVAAVQAAEMAGKLSQADGNNTIAEAWAALSVVRSAYNAGQAVDLTQLNSIKAKVPQ